MGKYAFYTIPSIKLSQCTQFSAHNEFPFLKVNFLELLDAFFGDAAEEQEESYFLNC